MRSQPGKSGADSKAEFELQGMPVSRGIAHGKVVVLYGTERQFARTIITTREVPREIARFTRAFMSVQSALRGASKQTSKTSENIADIFRGHLAILSDPTIAEGVAKRITGDAVNAEWAVTSLFAEIAARYKAIPDAGLRERYLDVEDIGERILNALDGAASSLLRVGAGAVIAAAELRPSSLVELAAKKPAALITENGGWTSHTFIIARDLGIPAVTAVKRATSRIESGSTVIVDGFSGRVTVNPASIEIEPPRDAGDRIRKTPAAKPERLTTLDGHLIGIRVNTESAAGYRRAKALGAKGIGLYRSETLFSSRGVVPSEEEQAAAYRRAARAAGRDGVRIRTFDIDGDRGATGTPRERNPALGLRAIRYGLENPKQLRTQLRALLAASHENNLDIVFPMITGVSDLIQVTHVLNTEKRRLVKSGIPFGSPRIGAMIEVPGAVFAIEKILNRVDFLCLGTNDLVQYLLAVDRDNAQAARWFNSLDPSVLAAIRKVFAAAATGRKDVVVCGEMAGSPFYIPLLVGLGARQFSMNANSIVKVRETVVGIAVEECTTLASASLECETAAQVERLIRRAILKRWPHLVHLAS